MTDNRNWTAEIKHEHRVTLDLQGFPIQLTLSRDGNTVELVTRSPGMPEDDYYFSMDLGFEGPNDTLRRLINFLKLAYNEGADAIGRQTANRMYASTSKHPVESINELPPF